MKQIWERVKYISLFVQDQYSRDIILISTIVCMCPYVNFVGYNFYVLLQPYKYLICEYYILLYSFAVNCHYQNIFFQDLRSDCDLQRALHFFSKINVHLCDFFFKVAQQKNIYFRQKILLENMLFWEFQSVKTCHIHEE